MSALQATMRSAQAGIRPSLPQQPFRWGQVHNAPAQLAAASLPLPSSAGRPRMSLCRAEEGGGAGPQRTLPNPFSLPVMDDHGLDLSGMYDTLLYRGDADTLTHVIRLEGGFRAHPNHPAELLGKACLRCTLVSSKLKGDKIYQR